MMLPNPVGIMAESRVKPCKCRLLLVSNLPVSVFSIGIVFCFVLFFLILITQRYFKMFVEHFSRDNFTVVQNFEIHS